MTFNEGLEKCLNLRDLSGTKVQFLSLRFNFDASSVIQFLYFFKVSTLEAATSGSLSGAEGFTTQDDQEMLNRIEKQLKRRFAIGSQVSEDSIIKDFVKQKYPEPAVQKVIYFMIRRGELQHRMQRKMLYRLK